MSPFAETAQLDATLCCKHLEKGFLKWQICYGSAKRVARYEAWLRGVTTLFYVTTQTFVG